MYILYYRLYDWDDADFQPLFCSKNKYLLEDKLKQLFEENIKKQREYILFIKNLRKKFPQVNSSNRDEYDKEYSKHPQRSEYILYDPDNEIDGPSGEFIIEEITEL